VVRVVHAWAVRQLTHVLDALEDAAAADEHEQQLQRPQHARLPREQRGVSLRTAHKPRRHGGARELARGTQ